MFGTIQYAPLVTRIAETYLLFFARGMFDKKLGDSFILGVYGTMTDHLVFRSLLEDTLTWKISRNLLLLSKESFFINRRYLNRSPNFFFEGQ